MPVHRPDRLGVRFPDANTSRSCSSSVPLQGNRQRAHKISLGNKAYFDESSHTLNCSHCNCASSHFNSSNDGRRKDTLTRFGIGYLATSFWDIDETSFGYRALLSGLLLLRCLRSLLVPVGEHPRANTRSLHQPVVAARGSEEKCALGDDRITQAIWPTCSHRPQ